jgi:hypothetical protein
MIRSRGRRLSVNEAGDVFANYQSHQTLILYMRQASLGLPCQTSSRVETDTNRSCYMGHKSEWHTLQGHTVVDACRGSSSRRSASAFWKNMVHATRVLAKQSKLYEAELYPSPLN